jgi:hypothetical protein
MFWLYVLFLIFAVITAPAWLRWGLKAQDHLVLGLGLVQTGLAVLWVLLLIYA